MAIVHKPPIPTPTVRFRSVDVRALDSDKSGAVTGADIQKPTTLEGFDAGGKRFQVAITSAPNAVGIAC